MIEIPFPAYPQARPLFQDLEHHLFLTALFEGTITGQVYVDQPGQPRAGLVAYHHKLFLAGEPALPEFNQALASFFQEKVVQPRKAAGWDAFVVFCEQKDGWQALLAEICSPYKVIQAPRSYYEAVALLPDAPAGLPEGFSLHPVSAELLAGPIRGLDAIREEMCSERTSVEDFLAKSFGLVLVYQGELANEVAGFCMSEYNTGDRCEIGIATFEPHQRGGLATRMTHALVAQAHSQGITRVGWHCWSRNLASCATARKAGLELVREEIAQVVLLEEQG